MFCIQVCQKSKIIYKWFIFHTFLVCTESQYWPLFTVFTIMKLWKLFNNYNIGNKLAYWKTIYLSVKLLNTFMDFFHIISGPCSLRLLAWNTRQWVLSIYSPVYFFITQCVMIGFDLVPGLRNWSRLLSMGGSNRLPQLD